MTPYARHMALCRIIWLDPESDERRQTPPFWRHDLESRMAMVKRFGKPLYLIRCHEWRRKPSAGERAKRTYRVN